MERQGNENLKSEKNRKTVDDESGNGKLPAVFGMEKKKIVGKDKNNDSDHGKNDARARQTARKAEIFERFLEDEDDGDGRKEREKEKRKPECFAVRGLGENQADDDNKRGAKANQKIPTGEFFVFLCFDEFESHKINVWF